LEKEQGDILTFQVLKRRGRLIVQVPNKFGSFSIINDSLGPALLSAIGKLINRGIEGHHVHLHGFNWWKNVIEKEGFKLIAYKNIEFLSSVFTLPFSLLRIERGQLRAKLSFLNLLNDKISKYVPYTLASEWIMCFEKV